jgi:hypothetical protein
MGRQRKRRDETAMSASRQKADPLRRYLDVSGLGQEATFATGRLSISVVPCVGGEFASRLQQGGAGRLIAKQLFQPN